MESDGQIFDFFFVFGKKTGALGLFLMVFMFASQIWLPESEGSNLRSSFPAAVI
jgi:hypothetical protein